MEQTSTKQQDEATSQTSKGADCRAGAPTLLRASPLESKPCAELVLHPAGSGSPHRHQHKAGQREMGKNPASSQPPCFKENFFPPNEKIQRKCLWLGTEINEGNRADAVGCGSRNTGGTCITPKQSCGESRAGRGWQGGREGHWESWLAAGLCRQQAQQQRAEAAPAPGTCCGHGGQEQAAVGERARGKHCSLERARDRAACHLLPGVVIPGDGSGTEPRGVSLAAVMGSREGRMPQRQPGEPPAPAPGALHRSPAPPGMARAPLQLPKKSPSLRREAVGRCLPLQSPISGRKAQPDGT